MRHFAAVARKELKAYFGSPMAAIFVGIFLLASLFSFFWVEAFFAANTADLRPLFRWMPLLLILLVSTLTMRQWSEEERMGTLEVLLTLPVGLSDLVIGKFLAVLALVALALALTLGLPVTVAMLGNLDPGPVFTAYLGALLMASAYAAMGLFVSSRTNNQIIALMLTMLLAGFFYLVGSDTLTSLAGNRVTGILRGIGIGSRFASISRGVIDLRDLVYYLSLTGFFLAANGYSLARNSWSDGDESRRIRRRWRVGLVLLAANLLAANLWLAPFSFLRADLTEERMYSLSPVSRDVLSSLRDPLLIRGYFSDRTHPLLAPLVPRLKDLMEEYRIAGGGRVRVEFVDPRTDEELEGEANEIYGIKPVPFQISGRYEASVVNSYFNILIKYGDQFTTLGFEDLIQVRRNRGGGVDVSLRNPEYDITRAIKKVVYGFKSIDDVFAGLDKPLTLRLLITPDTLPDPLPDLAGKVKEVARELSERSAGKLKFVENDVAPAETDKAARSFGVRPMMVSLFSNKTFLFHLFISGGKGERERIYVTGSMDKADIRREIEAAIKRKGAGFMKTVAVWTPPPAGPYGRSASSYDLFQKVLRQSYNVVPARFSDGGLEGQADVLLLVAPQKMSDLDRLAVDQFLMRGGSVIVLSGRWQLDLPPGARTLNLKEVKDGLAPLLAHYGFDVGRKLVMDERNEPFPIPVTRNLGGFTVQEIRRMPYPFFVDVRPDAMAQDSPVTSRLAAVTMNWCSEITVDRKKTAGLRVVTLLRSSPKSWLGEAASIQPDFRLYPGLGFPSGGERKARTLAVLATGSFTSYFKGRKDPRLAAADKAKKDAKDKKKDERARKLALASAEAPVLPASPTTARLALVASSEFVNDAVFSISRSMGQDRYMNSLEFLQNLVDWSVADEDLLAIRSRGAHARLLEPMERKQQLFWEWLNYVLALAGLAGVYLFGLFKVRREKPMQLV